MTLENKPESLHPSVRVLRACVRLAGVSSQRLKVTTETTDQQNIRAIGPSYLPAVYPVYPRRVVEMQTTKQDWQLSEHLGHRQAQGREYGLSRM